MSSEDCVAMLKNMTKESRPVKRGILAQMTCQHILSCSISRAWKIEMKLFVLKKDDAVIGFAETDLPSTLFCFPEIILKVGFSTWRSGWGGGGLDIFI